MCVCTHACARARVCVHVLLSGQGVASDSLWCPFLELSSHRRTCWTRSVVFQCPLAMVLMSEESYVMLEYRRHR